MSPLDAIPKQSWADYVLYIYHWCCLAFHHLHILGRYSDALTYMCFFARGSKKKKKRISKHTQGRSDKDHGLDLDWICPLISTRSQHRFQKPFCAVTPHPRQIPNRPSIHGSPSGGERGDGDRAQGCQQARGAAPRPSLARSRRRGSGAANGDVTENTICQPLSHCLRSLFLGRLLF